MAPTPLILQIQQAAIDESASLTEALRKSKVACVKLKLDDFGQWVHHELTGHLNVDKADMPSYRLLRGEPQAQNPVRGWQPIGFQSQEIFDAVSSVPVSTPVSELESSLADAEPTGIFSFSYSIGQQNWMWEAMGYKWPLRVALDINRVRGILDAVRNALTDWTLKLEELGVVGEGLMFTDEDVKKSASASDAIATQINIGHVGAYVHQAQNSQVQGGINSTLDFDKVAQLSKEIEQQIGNLPDEVKAEITPHLSALKDSAVEQDASAANRALKGIRDICAKVGMSVAASGIVHLVGEVAPHIHL